MKHIIATSVIATLFATSAMAERRYATITQVEPRYKDVQHIQPIRECYTVDVPVYGNVSRGNGASGADVLGGMIIGGLLGKGVTGKDNGAAAGAVIGGIIAADQGQKGQQGIVGYRQEQRCETRNEYTTERKIRNYKIWFEYDGITTSTHTYNRYNVGDRIPVRITIQAE